jgi:hypothetical protein
MPIILNTKDDILRYIEGARRKNKTMKMMTIIMMMTMKMLVNFDDLQNVESLLDMNPIILLALR